MKEESEAKAAIGPANYWHIGPVYIRKWLALAAISTASLLVLGVFGLPTALLHPLSNAPPVYRYDDPALQSLSGVVQIEDDTGCIRYIGDVNQGAFTGHGKVYDAAGTLCYDGPLVNGVYEGEDAKVYLDGRLIYTGAMAANEYEGYGRRTDPNTGIISEGEFSQSMLEGEGKEYTSAEVLLREGTFSHDLLNGPGKEYSDAGILLREGTFADGLLQGEGKEYTQNGSLLYEGSFERGLYQGSGKLYAQETQALRYEGEFVNGKATGVGKLYHASGQLLYEGAVYDAAPRADAFLGLSLAEVEQAFSQHWQIYTWQDVTAFVYPYFHLMFISESPVEYVSPAAEQTQTEQERQELLDALRPEQTEQNKSEAAAQTSAQKTTETTEKTDYGDEELSPDSDPSAIVITQVLSYGAKLSGIAQTEDKQSYTTKDLSWQEWFSDYALGNELHSVVVKQTGQFIYRFTPVKEQAAADFEKQVAVNDTLETVTVWEKDKSQTLWYQTAKWRDAS